MVEDSPTGELSLFGVDLDPTDDELKLAFKAVLSRDLHAGRLRFRNPYQGVTAYLQDLIDRGVCEASGEVGIPSWLTPAPGMAELRLVTAENNLRFIDGGGCDEYAHRVGGFIRGQTAGQIPAMIAVDHSMTAGAVRALAERFDPSNITLLVADSHFDGLRFSERLDLFRWGQPGSADRSDSGCLDRFSVSSTQYADIPDSCNCANWIGHLVQEGVVLPDRLVVFGVSDYPTAEMRRDPRLRRYVNAYLRFERAGAAFVTREEIRRKGVRRALGAVLEERAADRLYLSLDADIGSLGAVHAARFMNAVGLGAEELYELARALRDAFHDRRIIGLDVCGIETFLLGREFPNGVKDRTLERLSDFIRILTGHDARHSIPEGVGGETAIIPA